MTPPPSRLRIAVLGAGRIGSAFAFQLAGAGGHEVTVIARPGSARLAQLQRDRAIVAAKGDRAEVRVADALDEDTPYDLLIVTMLAHQLEPLALALRRSRARRIQFMFNTFRPEDPRAAIGDDRCGFGMPFLQATLDADGRLDASIGAGGQKSLMDRQDEVDLFNAAGLPAVLEPEMTLWLRCHAPFCVAFESVCVAGERRGGGAAWGEALTVARGVHAGFALIRSLGFPVYPAAKRRVEAAPAWVAAAILWGLSRIPSFRRLLATGEEECRHLVDAMIASAPPGTPKTLLAEIAAMKPA